MRKINGNTLKIIACIMMLIDHIGAAVIVPVYAYGLSIKPFEFEQVKLVYDIMRHLGRSAFPIFCFLLVEGFVHTSNRLRYSLSLFIFALISELPYDLAFNSDEYPFSFDILEIYTRNQVEWLGSCNVMFTLFIAFVTLWCIDSIKGYLSSKELPYSNILYLIPGAAVVALAVLLANRINCDYHGIGILLVVLFYVLRPFESFSLFAGYIFLLSLIEVEVYSFPAFILLFLYNKRQGRKLYRLKYLFYAFYPAHMFILYLLRCVIFG